MSFNLGDLIQLLVGTGLEVAAPGNPIGLGMMAGGAGGMAGGAAGGGLSGGMSALTPDMASKLPSWLNPADVAGVMPMAGSSGGIGGSFGGGSSDSIGKLLKLLGPALGGGQQKPSPPPMPGIPPIGIMQSKPFQPITGQPIGGGAPTGGGSQAQTIQALLALLGMGNSTGGM